MESFFVVCMQLHVIFARLGLLVLHEGKVNGIQIVPKDFVTQMVQTPKMATDDHVLNMRYGWYIWVYKNQGNQCII